MSFTIIKNFDQVPSYLMLCKLADHYHVCLTGNEHSGSFSCRNVKGDYEFGQDGIHGKFAAHGVTGEFSFEFGKATVTVIEKPFWVRAMSLKHKIADGLDALCHTLAEWRSS